MRARRRPPRARFLFQHNDFPLLLQAAVPSQSHVQEALASGSDECPTQAFNIELQFFDNVDWTYRAALQRAANRWESVIQGDLPYVSFLSRPLDEWEPNLNSNVYFFAE